MSLENDGIPVSWDEIKLASRKLDWGAEQSQAGKNGARQYLSQTECEDARVQEHIAIPGYN